MLLSGYALLRGNPRLTEEEVKTTIEWNICCCTGYIKIVKAVLDASKLIAAERAIRENTPFSSHSFNDTLIHGLF
jgi:xanthine dehydrogenase iron-sulfur cluster and FAD-binding subunit A